MGHPTGMSHLQAAAICAICLQTWHSGMGHEVRSTERATRAEGHPGAVQLQGSSCTQAGPASIPFCVVFLKSIAEGIPGQGCLGQLSRHGWAAGFCSSGGVGTRRQ